MFNRSLARVLILNAACKSQAKTRDIISPIGQWKTVSVVFKACKRLKCVFTQTKLTFIIHWHNLITRYNRV